MDCSMRRVNFGHVEILAKTERASQVESPTRNREEVKNKSSSRRISKLQRAIPCSCNKLNLDFFEAFRELQSMQKSLKCNYRSNSTSGSDHACCQEEDCCCAQEDKKPQGRETSTGCSRLVGKKSRRHQLMRRALSSSPLVDDRLSSSLHSAPAYVETSTKSKQNGEGYTRSLPKRSTSMDDCLLDCFSLQDDSGIETHRDSPPVLPSRRSSRGGVLCNSRWS